MYGHKKSCGLVKICSNLSDRASTREESAMQENGAEVMHIKLTTDELLLTILLRIRVKGP